MASDAIPTLIENFTYEHGEEGMGYVDAVAAFGRPALPQLERALESGNPLVAARACFAIRKIDRGRYPDGECRQKGR